MDDNRLAFVLDGSDDEEFLLCLQYVQWVELDHKTKKSFAAHMGKHDTQLWRWITRWKRSGLLDKVRSITGLAMMEDVTVANRKVLNQWPLVVNEMVKMALHADREDVKLSSAKALYDMIVKPQMEQAPDPGSAEAQYIDMIIANPLALNPMSVSDNGRRKHSVPVVDLVASDGESDSQEPDEDKVDVGLQDTDGEQEQTSEELQ